MLSLAYYTYLLTSVLSYGEPNYMDCHVYYLAGLEYGLLPFAMLGGSVGIGTHQALHQ